MRGLGASRGAHQGRGHAHRLVPRVHGDRCDDRRRRHLAGFGDPRIGAMVVGPGPLAALCVALVRRRRDPALVALRTITIAPRRAGVSFVGPLHSVSPRLRPMHTTSPTSAHRLISHPDGMAAVVAVLAGIADALANPGPQWGAHRSVVSVTTIPAIRHLGAAAAYRSWNDVGGAAIQLAINVAGLVTAGTLTLLVQARSTTRPSPRLLRRR